MTNSTITNIAGTVQESNNPTPAAFTIGSLVPLFCFIALVLIAGWVVWRIRKGRVSKS